jgi:hypothetical protein
MLALMTCSTYTIRPTIPGERLSVTFTLILSLIAFKFAIGDSLPLVPYLTYLDRYIIMSFLFCSTIAIENVLAGKYFVNESDKWSDIPTEEYGARDVWTKNCG